MNKIKFFLVVSITIVFITLSIFIAKTMQARSTIYPYDTSKNYVYDFNQSNVTFTKLDFKNGKISLVNSNSANTSAFLKVNVESTFMGKYLQPSIELTSGQLSFIQYFEHGAKGIRYINISSLITKDDVEIVLHSNNIVIKDESIQLVSFENKDIKKQKILVLSPHPDDAEIAAYGFYSDFNQSYVVTITAGDSGKFKYNEIYQDKVQHFLKKGELRTWNSITVPLLGGISHDHILNLGFFDRSLLKMYHDKSKDISSDHTDTLDINTYRKQNISKMATGLKGGSNWNSLVENFIYLLDKIKPDIIVTPYPALDTHPDHKLTTVALIEAIKTLGIKEGYLYLYSNHYIFNEYFPYGKEGGTISLPPNFESNIYFDSIYSHSLTLDKQKDKVFALEAMHDLRLDTEWRFTKPVIKLAWEQIKRDVRGDDNSYYKRSVRSNELFFVVKIKNVYDKNILEHLNGEL